MARLPIVGVMGSGSEAHERRAREVGSWLAVEGVHLLTGGGGGVMASASKAFHETPGRRGLVIGVLPSSPSGSHPKPGYPNSWIEIPIVTHLPLSGERGTDPMSRNHINLLSSDVVIFLPGSAGTASEAQLAVAYNRPAIAYLGSRGEIPDLPAAIPDTSSFEELRRFVRAALNRVERSG